MSLFFAKAISILSSSSSIANCKNNHVKYKGNWKVEWHQKSSPKEWLNFSSYSVWLLFTLKNLDIQQILTVKFLLPRQPLNLPWCPLNRRFLHASMLWKANHLHCIMALKCLPWFAITIKSKVVQDFLTNICFSISNVRTICHLLHELSKQQTIWTTSSLHEKGA